MLDKNASADFYFDKAKDWKAEKIELRSIVKSCGLNEVLRWGKPTYVADSENILLIHSFKEYVAILFMKGAIMKDSKKLLIQQTPNVQAARQLRFSSVAEIKKLESVIKDYIKNAINIDKQGLKVVMKKTNEFTFPEELQLALDSVPGLADAFYALTPGKQRGYLLEIGGAKQSKTRTERVIKYIPYILQGKGLVKGKGIE